MTLPALPAQGATSWYPWATGVDSAARNTARTDTANVFTGAQRINAPVGVNADGSVRQPFVSHQYLAADAPGTIDKVAHELGTTITGDLSTATGGNPTFAWGLDVFTITGTAPNDGNGGNIQNLIESYTQAPSGTIATLIGLNVNAGFFGPGAGGTVTDLRTLNVSAPKRVEGATAGTATTAYTLFLEQCDPIGGGSAFSLFVSGGTSRFMGRVDVNGTIANGDPGALSIYAGFSSADGGRVELLRTSNGGHVRARLAIANAEFQVHDDTDATFSIGRTGIPKWTAAANAQTTVGAAGGASALPATPTKYLKVKDSAGTTYVIPAYAAA